MNGQEDDYDDVFRYISSPSFMGIAEDDEINDTMGTTFGAGDQDGGNTIRNIVPIPQQNQEPENIYQECPHPMGTQARVDDIQNAPVERDSFINDLLVSLSSPLGNALPAYDSFVDDDVLDIPAPPSSPTLMLNPGSDLSTELGPMINDRSTSMVNPHATQPGNDAPQDKVDSGGETSPININSLLELADIAMNELIMLGEVNSPSWIIDSSSKRITAEFQVISPLVPKRQVKFLRYCKMLRVGFWVVVDFTPRQENLNFSSDDGSYRLPSGVIIEDLKLAQRMTINYYLCITASPASIWKSNDSESARQDIRVMIRKNNVGEHTRIVLSAATSLWLPVSEKTAFDFLINPSFRNQWDILAIDVTTSIEEKIKIQKSRFHRNEVSLLQIEPGNSVLQETWNDASGALLVYAPVDMEKILASENSNSVQILPSGFSILPDGGGETDPNRSRVGCLLTLGYQMLHSVKPTEDVDQDFVKKVERLMDRTMGKIKSALSR
ncbi:hypothetical protein IGI04_001516 [Brassica rapa subsp. trilocularis]|uniref:START domain-containing protein n=1 Tax=Brassica rapa subsp. trilocularis TaxID=1813537 RepID=A0ABQ7NT10_BRACM|nr:hypothetical protein IGI04_001516 [Brassica rapa subsp. trilocularis]